MLGGFIKRIRFKNGRESFFKVLFFSYFLLGSFPLYAYKSCEIWWQQCLENDVPLATFENWLGDMQAQSRVAMRNHVKKMGYHSLLDAPSGLCIDYFGLQEEGIPIAYQGLDITPKLVSLAAQREIPVALGSIEKLPFEDSQFDVCYARHILEHLQHYHLALTELIRAAKREVLVVFFIKPTHLKDRINLSYHQGYALYHNAYDKEKLQSSAFFRIPKSTI